MKKFFAIAFIAASLVACNGGGDKKENPDTAAVVTPDTAAVVTPDTAAVVTPDTAAKAPVADTTKK